MKQPYEFLCFVPTYRKHGQTQDQNFFGVCLMNPFLGLIQAFSWHFRQGTKISTVLLRNKILSETLVWHPVLPPWSLTTLLRFEFADDPDETENDVEIQVPSCCTICCCCCIPKYLEGEAGASKLSRRSILSDKRETSSSSQNPMGIVEEGGINSNDNPSIIISSWITGHIRSKKLFFHALQRAKIQNSGTSTFNSSAQPLGLLMIWSILSLV